MDKTHHGLSKVERYKWTLSDVSSPGELRMVSKHDLKVDQSYQRSATETKVLRMAREFSWVAFGAVTVNARAGNLFVVDGQHRLLAALRRDDVTMVPCVVYTLPDAREEALGFLALNTNRKPVTAVDQFKAKILSGNPVSVFVEKLASMSGRVVSAHSGQGTVSCISLLESYAAEDMETLARLWPVIVAVCDGYPIQNALVKALWYAEKRMPEGASFGSGRWRDRLVEVGYTALMDGIRKAAAYHGSMAPSFAADGLVNAVNHKLRNTLVLED